MRKAIVALMLAAACREVMAPVGPTGLTADALAAAVGSWQLASFNGDAVPVAWADNYTCPGGAGPCVFNYYVDITAGSIVVNDDGSFASSLTKTKRFTDGSTEVLPVTPGGGSFTGSQSGGPIVLRFSGTTRGSGTISGTTMTFREIVTQNGVDIQLGDTWVYSRQP